MMISKLPKAERLCLGTVQFGMHYGINNAIGRKPYHEECFLILKKAIEMGITSFDTAASYGNAESILGEFGIGNYGVNVISKFVAKPDFSDEDVKIEINKSLRHIGMSSIYGYMLHCPSDVDRMDLIYGLKEAKHEGIIQHIGVSVYTPEEAIHVIENDFIDILQIPYNIFDRRWDKLDIFSIARKKNIKIYARSVFLQGLLLMEAKRLPGKLSQLKSPLNLFQNICKKYGYAPYEAALLYAVSNTRIHKIVFGVDTVEQLVRNISVLGKFKDFGECYSVLRRNFWDIPARFIMPNLWNLE